MKPFVIIFLFLSVFASAQNASDTIYNMSDVSKAPKFPGGMDAFYRFVANNFNVDGLKNNSGRVMVEFVVEKDSSISNVRVLKGIGGNSASEAVRVVKRAGKWKPGEVDGKPVRTRYNVPIQIQRAP